MNTIAMDSVLITSQAFVIYCFFTLLLTYLGGERSLLIMLHGRPPKDAMFPLSLFKREIDVSDPYMFLFLKRGILQYVQIKPILAATTLILKACGKYNEGDFRANSGYLYISIIYNTSICLSLYCLAIFWACVNDDLKPYRPVPKFLCVKGILFFSFWQSVGISILVATNIITRLGEYTDREHVSTGWNNLFICVEMPIFAFLHMFAFSYKDYIDARHTFVARMPFYYAFKDAFGLKDVVEDSKATLRGEGMDYREFEPAEGFMHQGEGRDRRMRAGLRYSRGGQKKYWLPKAVPSQENRFIDRAASKLGVESEAHAPLLARQAQSVVHLAPDMMQDRDDEPSFWGEPEVEDGYELPFGDIDEADEELFAHSRQYLFGDYNYPCIDVSTESARRTMWDEEERVLSDERGAWFSPIRGANGVEAIKKREAPAWQGYGAVGTSERPEVSSSASPPRVNQVDASKPVIDFEQDRAVERDGNGVLLKWAKSKPASSSPQLSATVIQRADSNSSASSSSSKGKRRAPKPAQPSPPVLPEDAVDLVVEDPHSPKDRGLRKVYRKGFETEHVQGEVEVEDPSHHNRRRVDVGEGIIHSIKGELSPGLVASREDVRSRSLSPWEEDEPVVATVSTPPLHVRVDAYQFNDIRDNEHNPWA